MNKKILFALLIIGVLVLSYNLYSRQETFEEKPATDKDSEIAVKFSKYVFDYSKKHNDKEFYKKFYGIPEDCKSYMWNIFGEINSLPEPVKVTSPTMGKAKRYVYYDVKGKKYCFTVSLIKKRWQFKGVKEVKR